MCESGEDFFIGILEWEELHRGQNSVAPVALTYYTIAPLKGAAQNELSNELPVLSWDL